MPVDSTRTATPPVGLSAQSRNLWLAAMLHRRRADALAAAEPREARR